MQQNEVGKGQMLRPVCPLPIYFNKPTSDKPVEKSETMFEAFYEQSNINTFIPCLKELGFILKQNCNLQGNSKDCLGVPGNSELLEQRPKEFQENSSQKGEFMIGDQGKNITQKSVYSKFLKRSTANDTKNIPKNFGKAMISFIQKNQKITIRCIRRYNISMEVFIKELKLNKKILHSIRELRSLWLEKDFIYAKPFRELSYYFLRRAGHRYIFGSRVSDFSNHLKYRYRIMKALKCPQTFNSIKI